MDIILENACLKVAIKSKGAELFSVIRKDNQLEYIWSGDPAVWGKTSPILFPFVGTLKNDTYLYENERYKLPRHGFARDADFKIIHREKQQAVFLLKDSSGFIYQLPVYF